MKNLITILTILTVVSCGRQNKNESAENTFNFPIILQPTTTDTIEYFIADHITHSWSRFAGKSKFSDTLKLSIRRDRDTTYSEDFIHESIVWRSDSLRTDGFELFPDYKSTVSRIDYDARKGKYFYPVYIVNQTPTTKVFFGKDSYVFAIQEALDTNLNWRPIEGRGFDFCGNGYWGLKIHPKEFLTFLMPKYQGNYKTKIRVRIKIGDIIYVSHPFEGTINEKQFYLDENDGYHYRQLVENKASAIQHLFYGAEYKLGEVLQGQIKVPNLLGTEPFDSDFTLYLDEINEADNNFIIRSTQEVNKEQLTNATFDYLTKMANTMKVTPPKREDLKDLKNETLTASRMHGTGWVVYSVQTTTVTSDNVTNIEERVIEIK